MRIAALLCSCLLLASTVSAEVVRVVVERRADVLNGKSWGNTGPYEKLYGMIYYASIHAIPPTRRSPI